MYTYRMDYEKVLFDLDGTLYPNRIGLWNEIAEKIYTYMHEKLDMQLDEIPQIRDYYFTTYGTTLRGLQHDFPHLDTEEYLNFIHNVNIQKYIDPNPILRSQLEQLPMEKWIFTNADREHAKRVTQHLGIQDQFTGIVDVRSLNFFAKPEPEAYQAAFKVINNDPKKTIFLEDQIRNLAPAKQMGLYTIHLVTEEHHDCTADACFNSINQAVTHITSLLN